MKNLKIDGGMGKLPPQALDLEEAVLGALLMESKAINEVAHILTPEIFYKESHVKIYSAILDLFSKSEKIDILTVANKLRTTGELELVGGAYYITELTGRVNSSAHIQEHVRIIVEQSIKRGLISIASEILKLGYDDTSDAFDLLESLQSRLLQISTGIATSEVKKFKDIISTVLKNIETAMSLPSGVTGIPSGFTDIDKITGGWQKGTLIIIAARPSMGKTAFVVNTVLNAAVRFNVPVALFSLEMSDQQLVTRMIASELDDFSISTNQMTRGRIDDMEFKYITKKIGPMANCEIFIDDTPSLNISQLRAKCHKLKVKHNIQMIVVDYLQLMKGVGKSKGGNREQEISEISRELKIIAKELNMPVIALSQLSRAVELRSDKRPMLSDLRESGAIEQDADIVSFLYRPEYYKITQDEMGNSLEGIAEFIISKHRTGALGTVFMNFDSRKTKFSDIMENSFNQAF